jgi:ribosome production factor 1
LQIVEGQKPINGAKVKRPVTRNPGHINNKLKRSEVYGKYLQEKAQQKKELKLQRLKEAEALGDEDSEKPKPKTLDDTRELEPTLVLDDPEVMADEAEDEFAPYFSDDVRPKILITTRPKPSQQLFHFIADLQVLIPNLHFYPRKSYSLKAPLAPIANSRT